MQGLLIGMGAYCPFRIPPKFNPHFNFVFDIEDGKFREVKFAIENTTLELNASLSLQAQSSLMAALDKELANIDRRYLFFVKFVPVVMDLDLNINSMVRSQFEGGINTTISYTNRSELDFGAAYTGGSVDFIRSFENNNSLNGEVNVEAEGQTTFYIYPQIYVEFYSALSTVFKAEPYMQFFARGGVGTNGAEFCAEVNAGIDFTLGFSETLFGLFDNSIRIEGDKETMWETEGGCEMPLLSISNPSSQIQEGVSLYCQPSHDALYNFIYNYEYTEQPGELLKTPVEVQLFWHDDTGEHGNLTFTLSDSDPFQTVAPALFSHGICVDWDSRSSYEVSTYIVDQEGVESNQVSFVLVK